MDAVAEWTQAQARVISLVAGLSPDEAAVPVPACPAWTVHDLLAHVVGLDADVLIGDEPDDHNPGWTQKQVDARANTDIAGIVAEWRTLSAPLQQWMRDNNSRPLGDVIIHEQDLRGALAASGAHDTDGLRALRDRMADGFSAAVSDAGLPTVELVSPSWTFTASQGEPAVTVRAPEFELTRALMSRRSEAQLRSWTTAGDLTPYLPMFGALGPLPENDLSE